MTYETKAIDPQARLFDEPTPAKGQSVWRTNQTPGLLKSAVQKAIRRGDLGLLRWALDRVWRREEGRAWLCRRLPILAAEEAWPSLGWAGYTARLGQSLLQQPEGKATAQALLEGTFGTLATSAKDKDAGGIATLTRWEVGVETSPTALVRALEAKNPVRATAIAFTLAVQKADPWQMLVHWAAQHGTMEAVQVIWEAKARYGGGALPGDLPLFVSSAVLAALTPEPIPTRVLFHSVEAPPAPPPWGVVDMHVDDGRRVLALVARLHHLPQEVLSGLWFCLESARVDQETTEGWWPQSIEREMQRLGYPSVEAAREVWERLRPEVQARVEATLPQALVEVERWAAG